MRRALVGLLGVALLLVGLACCRRPVPAPVPSPAPAPDVPDVPVPPAVVAPAPPPPPPYKGTPTAPVQPQPPRRVRASKQAKAAVLPAPVPGHDQIRYSAPTRMSLAVPVLCTVDIGTPGTIAKLAAEAGPYHVQNLPKASHYLIGLEAEFSDRFKIEPNPGQDQRQHRAQTGQVAHWQYRVTPLKTGRHKLFYTLRVYQEGDDAGTVIRVEPVEVLVSLEWPTSHKAEALRMAREYGVWTALVGLVAALLGAWLKPRSKDN